MRRTRKAPRAGRANASRGRRSPPRMGLLLLASLGAWPGVPGCDLPRDGRGTLDRVRGGTLRVGVIEAPPRVTREGDEARGPEAELVSSLARRLDAEVAWRWGTPDELHAELEGAGLDLLIGAFGPGSVLARGVGATRPHGASPVGPVLLVPPGENGWLLWLERELAAAATGRAGREAEDPASPGGRP